LVWSDPCPPFIARSLEDVDEDVDEWEKKGIGRYRLRNVIRVQS